MDGGLLLQHNDTYRKWFCDGKSGINKICCEIGGLAPSVIRTFANDGYPIHIVTYQACVANSYSNTQK
jgi:hypothetical protein